MAPELKNCSLIWTYEESRNHNEETENIPVHIYVLTELMKESLASETSAVLFRFTIPDQSNLSTDDEKDLVVERVLTLDELPLTKRCLAIGNDFAVVCRNKRIKVDHK
jgi:hypothetical protein